MPLDLALATLGALVLIGALIGLAMRHRSATPRAVATPDALPVKHYGREATLVLFSTELCAQCPSVRRSLTELAASNAGVIHVDVDITNDLHVARNLRILQTPTTFLLDADGAVHARFSGATPRAAFEASLNEILTKQGATRV